MNTFISSTTGFSPYELVFLKKPPDIPNLYFKPLETIAKGYRDYCLKMRTKLDNVSTFITELKTFQQQRQALEKNTQAKKLEVFQKGSISLSFCSFSGFTSNQHKEMSCRFCRSFSDQ